MQDDKATSSKKRGYKNITGKKIILNKSKKLYFSIWMAFENAFFCMQPLHRANIVCNWKHLKKFLLKSKTAMVNNEVCP